MVSGICFFGFVCMILHFCLSVGTRGAVPPFNGLGTALLLYGGGAIVLSGLKESIAKIAAAAVLVIFRLPLLICFAFQVVILCVLYGMKWLLERVGNNDEK